MKSLKICSKSAKQTIDFAKKLSKHLNSGDVLGFFGNLGSGKTTFIKGIAGGLGFKKDVSSPSFVVLKIYPVSKRKKINFLYHFDLYRLNNLKDLEDIGYEDFVSNKGICVIEWADRAKEILPKEYLKININNKNEFEREILLTGFGKKYLDLINKVKKQEKC